MSTFTVKYSRTTNHIDGIGCKTQSACGTLTRSRLATGKSFANVEDALVNALIANGKKICKNCEKAALAEIEKEVAFQRRREASMMPATEAHDLGYAHKDEHAAADAQPEEVKKVRREAANRASVLEQFVKEELSRPAPGETVVTVELDSPTEGIVLGVSPDGREMLGAVARVAVDFSPKHGWNARSDDDLTVAMWMPTPEAAALALMAYYQVTGSVRVDVTREYRQKS